MDDQCSRFFDHMAKMVRTAVFVNGKDATIVVMDERPAAPSLPTPTKRLFFLSIPVALIVVLGLIGDFALRPLTSSQQAATSTAATVSALPIDAASSTVVHMPLPDEVRGLYWTAYTAGTDRGKTLADYAVRSHLNAIVVDLKLDNGTLAFVPNDPGLKKNAPRLPAIADLEALLTTLAEKKMYRIARIFVMRDGAFGKLHPNIALRNADGSIWHDKTGTPWLDPAAPEVTEYALALAREAYARGFDEVQFDYVRFPTDGKISAIHYPIFNSSMTRVDVMKKFFQDVGGGLQKDKIPVSFDLFGMTFWRTDDFLIGQRLADAIPFADFVSPMVYPSHYPNGFQSFANPAMHPYEIVKQSLDKGIETIRVDDPNVDPPAARKKFRPWLQNFDIGATYDAAKIEAQIKAARDAGASGWMLWNARNIYTPATYLKKQ